MLGFRWFGFPLVVGPESVPVITSVLEAASDPELAVLSILAHGNDDTAVAMLPAAVRAVRAMDALDPDLAELYFELVAQTLRPAIRGAFEEMMKIENYEWKSDYGRRLRAEGIAEGIAEGKAEGIAEGKAEGIAEGKAEGIAESILAILRERGLAVGSDAEARIRACRDLAELGRWTKLAVTAHSADALFE